MRQLLLSEVATLKVAVCGVEAGGWIVMLQDMGPSSRMSLPTWDATGPCEPSQEEHERCYKGLTGYSNGSWSLIGQATLPGVDGEAGDDVQMWLAIDLTRVARPICPVSNEVVLVSAGQAHLYLTSASASKLDALTQLCLFYACLRLGELNWRSR